jgi:hypothetical protein
MIDTGWLPVSILAYHRGSEHVVPDGFVSSTTMIDLDAIIVKDKHGGTSGECFLICMKWKDDGSKDEVTELTYQPDLKAFLLLDSLFNM